MTVDEGLQAVARLCHLTIRREKDLLYVYTTAEADQGDDPPVRVYHLNYVRGSDLQKMIKPLLSKRGAITASPDSEGGDQKRCEQGRRRLARRRPTCSSCRIASACLKRSTGWSRNSTCSRRKC